MGIIRTKDMLPEVYSSESRDFQILTRVLDYVQNSVKFDIDTIKSINSTEDISSVYLERLKSKLGFFTEKMFPDEQLRFILEVFPYILRYKGSITGIKRCVYSYLKIINSTSGALINIDRENHLISVGLPGTEIDLNLLEEMLKYVIPVGFYLDLYDASTLSDTSYSELYKTKSIVKKSNLPQGNNDNSTIINAPMNDDNYETDSIMNTVNIGTVITVTDGEDDQNEG